MPLAYSTMAMAEVGLSLRAVLNMARPVSLLAPWVRPSSEPTLSITSAWKAPSAMWASACWGWSAMQRSSAVLILLPRPCDSALATLMPWL